MNIYLPANAKPSYFMERTRQNRVAHTNVDIRLGDSEG